MQTPATLQRTLQSLFITGIYIFALAPAFVADTIEVTANNDVRTESDFQMKGYIESYNNFRKFEHFREAYDVHNQVTVRGNRGTLYSFGVFDLSSPLTGTLPDPKERYPSLMVVSQDHSLDVSFLKDPPSMQAKIRSRSSVCGSDWLCESVSSGEGLMIRQTPWGREQ